MEAGKEEGKDRTATQSETIPRAISQKANKKEPGFIYASTKKEGKASVSEKALAKKNCVQ